MAGCTARHEPASSRSDLLVELSRLRTVVLVSGRARARFTPSLGPFPPSVSSGVLAGGVISTPGSGAVVVGARAVRWSPGARPWSRAHAHAGRVSACCEALARAKAPAGAAGDLETGAGHGRRPSSFSQATRLLRRELCRGIRPARPDVGYTPDLATSLRRSVPATLRPMTVGYSVSFSPGWPLSSGGAALSRRTHPEAVGS